MNIETAEDRVRHYLAEQAKDFRELIQKTNLRPSMGRVHRLRVITRRIRSALDLCGNGNSPELRGALKKLGRSLGRKRELDVMLNDAKIYGLTPPHIRQRQKAALRKVCRWTKTKTKRKISRKLKKVRKDLKHDPASLKLDKGINKRLNELNRLGRITNKEQAHKLRIAIKKTRYLLEALGRPSRPLRRLQNILGRIHDLEVLQKSVGKVSQVRRDQALALSEAIKLAPPVIQYAKHEIAALSRLTK